MKTLFYIASLLLLIIPTYGQTPIPHQLFYVAPNGNDANPGSIQKPLASIEEAQKRVREVKDKYPGISITVYFRGGKYYRTQTAIFTSEDSGTQKGPIEYKAFPGEIPYWLGGKALQLKWKKYKDGIYSANVPKGLVFESFFVNDQQQILARYPNADPKIRIFNGTAEDAISPVKVKNWKDPSGGYFHVLHRALWGGFHFKITGKNKKGELEMVGGWQNNRPENGLHPQLRYVENIFEELDDEREWFLDTKKNTLYFMPAADLDLQKAKIEVAYLENFIHIDGSEEKPVQFLNFEGFSFNRSVRTFMKSQERLLRSDWAIYRGGAILIEGGENCTIKNCNFYQIGSNAIFVNNYNRHVDISSCHMYDIGANAICFVGDTSAVRNPKFVPYGKPVSADELDTIPGPKTNRYPANCTAYDNLIHDIGQVEKQTAGVQISMAMDIKVSHNSIYNTPRAGINIGEGAWGGHIIEYNDVFNTVLETSDHGSFNSWGRDRFWMVGNDKTEARIDKYPEAILWDATKTTIIRHNRMRCDHGWDIDLDDGSSNYHIYNNLCLKGGIKLREGYLRRVENNIVVNNAMHPHVWLKNNHDVIRGNIFWTWHFPIRVNHWGKQIDFNWFVSNEALSEMQKLGIETHSQAGDPLFVNPQAGDFTLKNESPVYSIGWKTIPMDEFGVVSNSLKELAEVPEIPILNLIQRTKNKAFEFLGGEIKDIETSGELSATGMYDKTGVLVILSPTEGVFKKLKLEPGDVILGLNNWEIKDINGLFRDEKMFKNDQIHSIKVWRNQKTRVLSTKN